MADSSPIPEEVDLPRGSIHQVILGSRGPLHKFSLALMLWSGSLNVCAVEAAGCWKGLKGWFQSGYAVQAEVTYERL